MTIFLAIDLSLISLIFILSYTSNNSTTTDSLPSSDKLLTKSSEIVDKSFSNKTDKTKRKDIHVYFFQNKNCELYGFEISGRSAIGMISAAVSALAINTVNSIEALTDSSINMDCNDDGGYLRLIVPEIRNGTGNKDASLLLRSLALGINHVSKQYKGLVIVEYVEG